MARVNTNDMENDLKDKPVKRPRKISSTPTSIKIEHTFFEKLGGKGAELFNQMKKGHGVSLAELTKIIPSLKRTRFTIAVMEREAICRNDGAMITKVPGATTYTIKSFEV